MVTFRHKGNFDKTFNFFKKAQKFSIDDILNHYGREGVVALNLATPVNTGTTALSWDYEIHKSSTTSKIVWTNSNIVSGVVIAVILQYGHGTGTGGYVTGIDYINPALKPIFDSIAEKAWKEVVA